MKPLSVSEVQNLALELKTFEGSRLQEVRLSRDLLCFGFYSGDLFWLIFDLNGISPQIIMLSDLHRLKLRDEKKPIVLFLRANVLGAQLTRVEAPLASGRVLNLHFNNGSLCEIRLFPRGTNIIVQSQGKSIALHKPLAIKPLVTPAIESIEPAEILATKSNEWLAEWQTRNQKSTKNNLLPKIGENTSLDGGTTESSSVEVKKTEAKIQKAMRSIENDLKIKRAEKWSETGEWLKRHQSLKVPYELTTFIDFKKSFSSNLAHCFEKAKELRKKIAGAEARLIELQTQLVQIKSGEFCAARTAAGSSSLTKPPTLMKVAEARGRTFTLDEGITFYVGKSAEDNLRLLREAKPWYFWLHLRDEPSAHGILTRNKNQKISQSILHEAAQCLLSKTYGERQKDYYGQKFALLVAECRFVRPIKGDRIGRVHYSSETSFLHLFKNS